MTAEQLKAGRALVRISQQDLAERSGISLPTIKRLEVTEGELSAHVTTIRALRSALEGFGVHFIEENGGGPGVRLAKRK